MPHCRAKMLLGKRQSREDQKLLHHMRIASRLGHGHPMTAAIQYRERVDAEDIIQVLDALDETGARYWVGGGWGVAALAARQTREHRDLDLAVDALDLERCLTVLSRLGYAAETDWLPVRIELRAAGDRWVDVHPVVFGEDGHGRQAGLDGASFAYPPDAFASGQVAGRTVPCLSARQQRRFRTGYDLRPQDVHDLAQLDGLPEP
jgi:lincosamide nucleotidyltransferase A/C/D/E